MLVKRERINAKGRREVTVELRQGEKIVAVDEHQHYRLGGQMDDIVPGHVLTEAERAYWCPFEQKWKTD